LSDDRGGHYSERTGEQVAEKAAEWLAREHSKPFFLFLHFFDPHAPYNPPEPYRSRFKDDPYSGEVAYVDDCFGRILEVLKETKRFDNSLIIVFGDHGESLGEHGEDSHGYFVYDSTLRVPLIVKPPKSQQEIATRVDNLVSLVDIFPTVLQYVGTDIPPIDGVSLVPAIENSEASSEKPQRRLYSETIMPSRFGWSPLASIRTLEHKYIEAPSPELYDLRVDLLESKNLIMENAELAKKMRAQLREMTKGFAKHAAQAETVSIDQDSRKRLDSLGYVKGTARKSSLVGDIPPVQPELEDPKNALPVYKTILESLDAIEQHDHEKAIAGLESVLKKEPGMERLWASLGFVHLQQSRYQNAISAYEKAVDLNPEYGTALLQMGDAFAAMHDNDQAAKSYIAASRTDHVSRYHAHMRLGNLKMNEDDPESAVAEFRQALKVQPDSADCLLNLAVALAGTGNLSEARKNVDRSLSLVPSSEKAKGFSEFLRKNGY